MRWRVDVSISGQIWMRWDYFDDHEDARRCARALAAWPMRRIVKETTRFISVKDWSPRE